MSHQPDAEFVVRGPLESVRALENRFFRNGTFEVHILIGLIVEEAILMGAADVLVRRLEDWWWLASSLDWLTEGDRDVSKHAFDRIQSYPQGGPNSMRPEVLATAFCRDVVTITSSGPTVIAGKMPPMNGWPEPMSRVVAFRV